MNEQEIEDYICKTIEDFEPKIKNQFVYNFSNNIQGEGKGFVKMAMCNRMFKPPLITFFTKVIAQAPDLSSKLIEQLINHEALHTFYDFQERAAIGGQDIVNFHKK